MKNLLLAMCLVFFTMHISAQTLPNSDFELWDDEASYPSPESWNTPNKYTLLANVYVVEQSTDAYSGSYAARLETKIIDVLGTEVLVPENEEYDTIGYGYTYLHDAEEWTPFVVNMRYINGHVPDTFNVLFMSTTDEGLTDPAHAGSVLLIDSLAIHTNTGILNLWEKPVALHIFPNPATTNISFETEEIATGRQLILSDPAGKILLKREFQNKIINLPLSGSKRYCINTQRRQNRR